MLAILGDLLGAGIAAARLRQRIARTEVERERLRLAAEIHDGLAQDLALAKREIALLDSDPAPGAGGREPGAPARGGGRGAPHRARAPGGPLHARADRRPARRGRGGVRPRARARAARRAARRAGVEPAEPEAAAVVLRVLGEALANVERHAGAGARASSPSTGRTARLALTVEDDGRGLGALDDGGPGDGHFGIALMRERAASIGGRLAVGPGAAGGTRVRLEVPRA